MEKVRMESMDMTKDNVQKIAALFPNCVTEHKDAKGNVVLGIDFEKLQVELGEDIIGKNEERYQFTWPDKRLAIREANTATTSTLRPCKEESVDFDNTKNLYIEGDNLEVLKCLRETYLGKVKMIYIDPPYNTGNDFVYNDDFASYAAEYKDNSGQKNEEGYRLFKNIESNGRFHTDWLNMMYPRLKVARDLLSEDGVIYVSLDDNEIYNLKKITDEIFGSYNFVANVIWIKKYGIQNDAKYYSTSHDYIVAISKNKDLYKQNLLPRTAIQDNRYKNIDSDPRGAWKAADFTVPHVSLNRIYSITLPSGRIVTPADGRCWGASEEEYKKLVEDNRIWFGAKGDNIPAVKKFLSEVKDGITATTVWHYDEVSHTDKAKKDLATLMQGTYFDYPKPSELIKKILKISSNKDCVILDFFSGSATTAHAVMQLNAEDKGNRQFIMVQLPEFKFRKFLNSPFLVHKSV